MPTLLSRPLFLSVLFTTLVLFGLLSNHLEVAQPLLQYFPTAASKYPDFGQYVRLLKLSSHEFPTDDPNRRVIVVGDVHGMIEPLHKLLQKVNYDVNQDTLVHVGDIVSKGTLPHSLSTLSYMASNNITGVRGNHDQKVIEWRAWIKWIHRLPGGKHWLEDLYERWSRAEVNGAKLENWLEREMKHSKRSKWWKRVPKDWVLFGDHYSIARKMSEEEYQYLLDLPLSLYIPSAHTHIVHAGMLSSDPKYDPHHRRQPLARVPALPRSRKNNGQSEDDITILRELQESALLRSVPQNKNPYVLLNMRNVLKNGVISRSTQVGTPWAHTWARDMRLCDGFSPDEHLTLADNPDEHSLRRKKPLPCYPSSVIYGHTASRGLDVKRWSIGLDSGCVYGRRLTALVLGGKSRNPSLDFDDDEDEGGEMEEARKKKKHKSHVRFGDHSRGRIVSVKC